MTRTVLHGAITMFAGAAITAVQLAPANAQPALASLQAAEVGANASCAVLGSGTDPRSNTFRRMGHLPAGAWTFVMNPEAETFQNRLPAAAPTNERPAFGERVTIYAADSESQRLLVGWPRTQGDPRHCAWIKSEHLVGRTDANGVPRSTTIPEFLAMESGPPPLRVGQVSGVDRQNTLTLKAVLNNLNQSGDNGIPVYDRPTAAGPRGQLKLFEFYTVYAQASGTRRPGNNSNRYFLLGKSEGGDPVIRGWIHADDFYAWNTRMAVFWAGTMRGRGWFSDSMTGPADIFETPGASFRDETGGRHRLPVLEMRPSPRQVQERTQDPNFERTPLALSGAVDAYQIAVPIKSCGPTRNCVDAGTAEDERKQIRRMIENLGRIDIRFLIDATESMDVYFDPAVQAIRDFITRFGNGQSSIQAEFQFGVAVYGDYRGDVASVDNVWFEELAPIHDPTINRAALGRVEAFARDFKNRAPRDPHADLLEAPFAAIIRASRSGWRNNAGIRLIVHLADHGNRDKGSTSGQNTGPREVLGVSDVVAAMRRNRVVYIPINVLGGALDNPTAAAAARDAFRQQSRQILKERGLAPIVSQSYTSDRDVAETPQQRRQAIEVALRKALDTYVTADAIVRRRELCAINPEDARCGLSRDARDVPANERVDDDIARLSDTVTSESGLSEEQFRNILSRRDTVAYAWTKPISRDKEPPVDTLTYWVAVAQSELSQLVQNFGSLCQALDPNDQRSLPGQRMIAVVDEMIRVSGGEGDGKVDANIRLGQALSLPFWERFELLGMPRSTMNAVLKENDPSLIVDWRFRFCRAAFLLNETTQSRRILDLNILHRRSDGQVDTAAIPKNQNPTYNWLVKTEGGEAFYYIPVEYLP